MYLVLCFTVLKRETGAVNVKRLGMTRCGTLDVCDISERVLYCGDFSGNLLSWDMESLEQIQSSKAHTDVINSISGGGFGSNEILTGG